MSSNLNHHALARLGVGFVGSGFNARFHMQGLQAARDVEVRGDRIDAGGGERGRRLWL